MKKTKDEDLDKEPTNEAMQYQMKKERGFITFVLASFRTARNSLTVSHPISAWSDSSSFTVAS